MSIHEIIQSMSAIGGIAIILILSDGKGSPLADLPGFRYLPAEVLPDRVIL